MTDPSQSSSLQPGLRTASGNTFSPGMPVRQPIPNTQLGAKAVPTMMPPGTMNCPRGGFVWRPMPVNIQRMMMNRQCPPNYMNMNPPMFPNVYPPRFQQMPPPQMYPPQQQMYPPPQMYPPQQQMYPIPQMYPPQRQMYPPRQMNQNPQRNYPPNYALGSCNKCCKLTQTQTKPTIVDKALSMIDQLTCYEERPCNLGDNPKFLKKCCESDFDWLCGLLKELISKFTSFAGKSSSCCEDTYNSSFAPCKPCNNSSGNDNIDKDNMISEMPQVQIQGDSMTSGKSQVESLGDNLNSDDTLSIFQGSMESFPDDLSVTQFFVNGLEKMKDKTALIEEKTVHNFQKLHDVTNKIAEVLRLELEVLTTMNPDGDTVIGICIPPSDKLIFVIFAILKLGAAYVPFEVAMPEDRIMRIVKDCKPLLIVSDSLGNTIGKFDGVRDLVKVIGYSDIIEIVDKMKRDSSDDHILPVAGPPSLSERTAIVLYTSGSSGEPKGVRLSHRAILNRLNWQWKVFPYDTVEQCVFKTSLTFVDSVCEIFGPLLQGYPVVIFSKLIVQNPSAFIQRLDIYSVTRVVLVPSLMKAIFQTLKLLDIKERENLLNAVQLWVVSGEALQKELIDEFFRVFPRQHVMANFYGSTEIMGDVTYITYNTEQSVSDKTVENQVPIGVCIYNTIVYILDNNMQLTPENESGEIYVAGYNLAKGYVGIPDSDKFVKNPFSTKPGFNRLYRTGDFGRITKTRDGTKVVLYEGRMDSQIKVRGQRVDLHEIEYALTKLPFVLKSVVLCYHPGLPDQEIVAFILAEPETTDEIVKHELEKQLRPYEIPVIRLLKEFPYLINGKTDRQRLLRSFELEHEERCEFEDWDSLDSIPKHEAEAGKILIKAISEITGTSIQTIVIHLDDSFFNLGGTSLNSVDVILKLKENFYEISVIDFVTAESILDIIDHMKSTKEGGKIGKKSIFQNIYAVEKLVDSMQEDVVQIISYSFSQKGDLEAYTHSAYEEFATLIKSMWKGIIEKDLSFIVRRTTDDQIVGAALNFDVYDEPEEADVSRGILYVFEMLELVETPSKEKLPKGVGKLLHNFMLGTRDHLSTSDNVKIVETMEANVIKLGHRLNFEGVFATNTNPLTKAICRDIFGYEVLLEYQVNQFVAEDGTRPWRLAPDAFTIICCWKKLSYSTDDMDEDE